MPFLNSWVKLDISVNDEWINGMDFDDLQTCLNEIDLIDEVLYNQSLWSKNYSTSIFLTFTSSK